MHRWMRALMAIVVGASLGCAINFSKRSPWDIQQLAELSDQLEQFKTLARLKAEEADQLRKAKGMLDGSLGADVSVGYDERGVVTRMLDQVLFDSGKAELRRSAYPVLDKVAKVLQEVPDQPVGVEGHTDTVPIKYSGWADNKALSVARANAVVHHLVEKGVSPDRLTAIGYGDERPIASNDAATGRQKNRRVEIIILPQSSGRSYEEEAERESRRSRAYSK